MSLYIVNSSSPYKPKNDSNTCLLKDRSCNENRSPRPDGSNWGRAEPRLLDTQSAVWHFGFDYYLRGINDTELYQQKNIHSHICSILYHWQLVICYHRVTVKKVVGRGRDTPQTSAAIDVPNLSIYRNNNREIFLPSSLSILIANLWRRANNHLTENPTITI